MRRSELAAAAERQHFLDAQWRAWWRRAALSRTRLAHPTNRNEAEPTPTDARLALRARRARARERRGRVTALRSLRKVSYETTHRGTRLRVVLDDPPGNVLDEVMLEDLARCLSEHGARKELRCVTLEGRGKNFSFGASIAEHRREHAHAMLARMAGLARQLLSLNVATQAIVRGQCLGGGLELALCCSRIVASPGAKLGQPESKLGVFAPIASMLLRERVGQAVAEDLLLSGRAIGAREALKRGLVEEVAADPGGGAVKYFSAHLQPKSAAALRFVVDASRRALRTSAFPALAELESVYVEKLMATHDANEGVAAFLEKRAPRWRDA